MCAAEAPKQSTSKHAKLWCRKWRKQRTLKKSSAACVCGERLKIHQQGVEKFNFFVSSAHLLEGKAKARSEGSPKSSVESEEKLHKNSLHFKVSGGGILVRFLDSVKKFHRSNAFLSAALKCTVDWLHTETVEWANRWSNRVQATNRVERRE